MRLYPLLLSAVLALFSVAADAQIAEPFSPSGDLHPQQQHCARQEITGDNALPQYEQEATGLTCCYTRQI